MVEEDKQLSPLGFINMCLSWLQDTGIGTALLIGTAVAMGFWWTIGCYFVMSQRKKARIEGRFVRPVWKEFGPALFFSGMLVIPIIGYALGGLLVSYLGYIIFWIFTHPQ